MPLSAIIIYMAVGFACSDPIPLEEARAYVTSHPMPAGANGMRYIVTSDDPNFRMYVARCAGVMQWSKGAR